ncbi:MAG: NADH-quinone oxidoreductase subunit J [Acidimicrobiia bacterium]|nr:NADH-quinone oxidoreductase subunit J [Acidimicrobiia bacterium]
MEAILFVVFGAVSVAGALTVIMSRNAVYSALGLMATMFSLAVFYIVHLAHFVAAIQVIVYAGAVMTLFLFVIMLIGVDRDEDTTERLPFQKQVVAVLGVAVVALVGTLAVRGRFEWILAPSAGAAPEATNGTIQAVGRTLFGIGPGGQTAGWALPFEAVSLLLVVAAVGAIALAFFRPLRRKEDD